MPPENYSDIQVMKDVEGFFTEKQLDDMFDKARVKRDKVLIRLLRKSGRRITEVINCKRGDIDFDNSMICWIILKKRKLIKKWKPIDQITLKLLSEYILEANIRDPNYYLLHTGVRTEFNPMNNLNLNWSK